MCVHPKGTAGDSDTSPGDDNGVFDGLGGNVDTEEGSVSVVSHLDVDGESLCILKEPIPHTWVTMCQSVHGGTGPEHVCRSSENIAWRSSNIQYTYSNIQTVTQKNPQKHPRSPVFQVFQTCPQIFPEMIPSSGH